MATTNKSAAHSARADIPHKRNPLLPAFSPSRGSGSFGTDQTSSSEGEDDEATGGAASDDEDDKDASDENDVSTPSMASKHKHSVSIETPTKQSSKLLAGLQVTSAKAAKDDSVSDAVKQRIAELEASGWRPDEDMASLDDDDYNDVDLISETDEEDKSMRMEEEKAMFRDGQMSIEDQGTLARRLSLDSRTGGEMDLSVLDDLDFDAGEAMQEGLSLGAILDLDFGARRYNERDEEDDDDTISAPTQTQSNQPESQRRVRFEDELDGSDVDSTDDEQVAETFPDLFMEAHQLGPAFQQAADDETYIDDGSDAGSCWDFEGDDMQIDDDDDESASDSPGASSGYYSDDGETTDEEAPPPPASIQRAAERRTSNSDASVSSATDTAKASASKKKLQKRKLGSKRTSSPRLPTSGTFMLDPRRPVLLVNGYGNAQRNTIYPAKIQTPAEKRFWQRLRNVYKSQTTSPRTSVQLTPDDDDSEFDFAVDSLLGNETPDLFFNLLGTLRPDQIVGPPEAFMPFTNIDTTGAVSEDHATQSVSEDEDKDLLSFVNFDSDSDDQEEAEESDSAETSWKSPATFPHIRSEASSRRQSQSDDLLAHLDRNRGLVGSFRRNQHFAKHIGSLASHPSVRANTSELNAMQVGRRSAGNTPITPLRKKKAGKDVGFRNSPITSPITSNKKKGPARGGFDGRR